MTTAQHKSTSTRAAMQSTTENEPYSATAPAEHILLSTREAASLTTYTPHSLENLRSAGRGPAFIKIKGGAVAYRLQDLLAWQESHRVSTLDQR
jgi:hypothetical protein